MTYKEKMKQKIAREVFYLESLPRLAFTDNMYSIMNTVFHLGMEGRYSTSAFWYQGLERLMDKAVEKGVKYALTIDYDTWFTEYHVIDLYEIMERHPELFALFPLQPRRGHPYPMAGTFVDPSGDKIRVLSGKFEDGVCAVDTGHFGLTLFRVDQFKRLKKPWLNSLPDPNGSWGEGKKDADVAFWIKCKNEGLKVGCAEIYIGHIQLLCSFVGTNEKGFKTQYVPMQNIFECKMPGWIEPKSSIKERLQNENWTTNGNKES